MLFRSTGDVPLVADASSHILSRPMDIARHGLVYAGAQKNIGPAGLVIVIVREDLLGRATKGTPTVMDYARQAEADSMLNTPATYSIYVAGLVFKWLKSLGGVADQGRDHEFVRADVVGQGAESGPHGGTTAHDGAHEEFVGDRRLLLGEGIAFRFFDCRDGHATAGAITYDGQAKRREEPAGLVVRLGADRGDGEHRVRARH
mgnify:CR=1 FL=1